MVFADYESLVTSDVVPTRKSYRLRTPRTERELYSVIWRSSVGKVTSYGLDDRGLIHDRSRDLFSNHVQPDSGFLQDSYPVCVVGIFRE